MHDRTEYGPRRRRCSEAEAIPQMRVFAPNSICMSSVFKGQLRPSISDWAERKASRTLFVRKTRNSHRASQAVFVHTVNPPPCAVLKHLFCVLLLGGLFKGVKTHWSSASISRNVRSIFFIRDLFKNPGIFFSDSSRTRPICSRRGKGVERRRIH